MQKVRLIHLINTLTVSLLILSSSLLATDYKVTLLNEDDGFDSSVIFSIVQDKHGFLWFGSGYEGLYRYDGKKVKALKHQADNTNSLPHNNAGNLFIDNADKLWTGSWGGGVSQYDQQSATFTRYHHNPDDISTVSGSYVQEIFQDRQGDIWVGTFRSGLNKFNPTTQTFNRYPFGALNNKATSSSRIWDIIQDGDESLWIGTSYGLNHFNKQTNKFSYYIPQENKRQLDQNKIRKIIKREDGHLLLATDIGMWSFNIESKVFTPLHTESNEKINEVFSIIKTSFNQYWLTSAHGVFSFTASDPILRKVNLGFDDSCSSTLFEDREGNIWLSCEGVGIYKIIVNETFSLIKDDVIKNPRTIALRNDETLLIGTYNGILNFNPTSKQTKPLSLPDETTRKVNYLFESNNGDLWYVSEHNLYRSNAEGVTRITAPTDHPHRELFQEIAYLAQDALGQIWIGTLHKGVFIIDEINNEFTYLDVTDSSKGINHNNTTSLYRDRDDRMWVSSLNGVNLFIEQTRQFKHFYFSSNESLDTGNNVGHVVFQDRKKRVWVGSATGLHLLNEETGQYTTFNVSKGLANNRVKIITEDDYGNLWLVTDIGASKLNPDNGKIKNYDSRDGLSSSRYFHTTATTSSGIIYFHSKDGLHTINTHLIHEQGEHKKLSNTVLSHFEVLGSTEKEPLYYPPITTEINLAHDENDIKFEFATLDFSNSAQINYMYQLEGFNDSWVDNGKNNSATYTNLEGGTYTFKVRSLYRDNEFYDQGLSIKLTVEIPVWQRWWMYVIYCVVGLLLLQFYIKRKNQQQQQEIERQKLFVTELEQQVKEKTASIEQESEKRLEATQVKSQFLANMSHEIRTPLTSIIGQSEAIINDEIDPRDLHAEVEVIFNQSHYLLKLINEILDLSKIEANKFELNIQEHNVSKLVSELNPIFKDQAKAKGLLFKISYNIPKNLYIKIDEVRLKQILINLCSNAIKFTNHGSVSIDVSLENDQLYFHVRDTGIGMTKEQLLHIFDAFSQGDNSISRRFGGSGLGLNLSEQLAEIMGGFIQVESELGKGSVLSLVLPHVSHITAQGKSHDSGFMPLVSYNNLRLKGKILLAEDHHDNRRLIARLLSRLGLEVIAVSNGQEAIDMYFKHKPSVILLDIQMPVMDGIDAIKVLKERGCHAKIIALTANAMLHEIKEYLALGFDNHLTKPIERNKFITTIAQLYQTEAPLDDEQMEQLEQNLNRVDMSDLIAKFVESLVDEHETILFNQQNNDLDSIAKQVHQLAGAAQMFGFSELADCAVKVEIAIKTSDVNNIQLLTNSLIDELENILGFSSRE
ncbi:hybrid sensor histidine kinase/response regulator [Psychrobium sp. 1_MG-2023]|uniref:hybrid sensor histidine kinase/response regulator n=1 Tax=Psychrobium sp. 1_MG-2023 TaxID=3062624 RepID=UPI000C336641|nr:hybrid sensor histidine kinase/response regulator [Psychrobium sp. 1_MG-2023]MDP2561921.1 two-component regulator propeller domain-containing protein [Psychrobium sp. 1_MG-2023]PKF59666.1 hypothetical protein CW748_00230 [Alteromonadales bacterium alter-6D02]